MEGLKCSCADGLELWVGDADAVLGTLLSSASKGEGRRTALGASNQTVGRRLFSRKALSAAAPMGLNSGSVMRMRYSAPSCQVQAKEERAHTAFRASDLKRVGRQYSWKGQWGGSSTHGRP